MGWNTTVVVHNDALHDIEKDPEFGKKLSTAILSLGCQDKTEDVSAGCHCNAATAIETHHADQIMAVAVGGNYGVKLGYAGQWPLMKDTEASKLHMLKILASGLGYDLHKKPKRRSSS